MKNEKWIMKNGLSFPSSSPEGFISKKGNSTTPHFELSEGKYLLVTAFLMIRWLR
jgi:hypothetical protein